MLVRWTCTCIWTSNSIVYATTIHNNISFDNDSCCYNVVYMWKYQELLCYRKAITTFINGAYIKVFFIGFISHTLPHFKHEQLSTDFKKKFYQVKFLCDFHKMTREERKINFIPLCPKQSFIRLILQDEIFPIAIPKAIFLFSIFLAWKTFFKKNFSLM